MSVTLLFQPFNASIDNLVLDASVKEEHDAEIEVTDHAVETGSKVSDHARPKPEEITIEGVVSNTPLSHLQTRRAALASGLVVETSAAVDYVRGMPGAAEAAYRTLRDLRDNPKLVTVVTALRSYDNMVMTSLKVPRDDKTGDVLRFTAKFKFIRQVTNGTTVVATKVPKAQKKQAGAKPTTSASTPVSAKGRQLLAKAGALK